MKKIFAANWKMHKGPRETREYFEFWKLKTTEHKLEGRKFIFFPPMVCLEAASHELKGTEFEFGAQNAHFEEKGAFTGETSACVLKEMDVDWVLIGHSERRQLFGENDEACGKKVKTAQDQGLKPMLCIGETLVQREDGKTFEVLKKQLAIGLQGARPEKPLAVAYEPVWAIGTGKVATPEQVQEAHAFVASQLHEMGFDTETTPVLYGGSVKPDNAKTLIALPKVDGFLVGGASLEVESFLAIARA